MLALAGLGVASLIAGIAALIDGQPYAVAYPLLLGGVLLPIVFGGGYRLARRAYRESELRKMHALDAAPS